MPYIYDYMECNDITRILYVHTTNANRDMCKLITVTYKSRLTVVSREAKKKQHARASSGLRDHYSELFTRMAALKF